MDHYITTNINVGSLTGETAVQFSVIDIAAAEAAYEAYGSFAAAGLKAAVKDSAVLAEIGRAASRSSRYAESAYRVYNTIDVGGFADGLIDLFPAESTTLKNAVKEAVLYHRENSYLADSQGLSVYMPVQIEGLGGISNYLEYICDICENIDVRALYYYKLAGCLNDELQEYVVSQGYGEAKKLDLTPLKALSSAQPVISGGDYAIPVSQAAADLIQTYQMFLAMNDEMFGEIIYLGCDNYAYFDGEGNLTTDFDAEWITLDGQLLAVEIVDETPSSVKYRSKVDYKGTDSWLLFSYDRDTEAFTILGIREIPTGISGNAADVANRALNPLTLGDRITPLYDVNDPETDMSYTDRGKSVVFSAATKITSRPLEDGEYLSFIVVTDPRGDEYYTPVMELSVSGGEVTDMGTNSDYFVITTAE